MASDVATKPETKEDIYISTRVYGLHLKSELLTYFVKLKFDAFQWLKSGAVLEIAFRQLTH